MTVKSLLHSAEPGRDANLRRSCVDQDAEFGGADSARNGRSWWRHAPIAAVVTATIAALITSCANGSESASPQEEPGAGRGEALYQSNCASCHGADLRGTDKGPSHLSIVYEPNHHGDDAFRSAIVNGARQHHWDFGDMAAIPGLDDEQIDGIIAFVRSEQEQQGFEQ